jgi:Leucine-rich repeat (LRR) protein
MAKLFIENNYIQSIPQTLPKTLTDFFIANNGIVKLPELPPFLKRISCHRNRIKEYEPFPPSIIYANLDGTPMQLDTKNSYILLGAMMNGL